MQPSFCTNCGTPLAPGAAFCTNCGAKIGGPQLPAFPTVPTEQPVFDIEGARGRHITVFSDKVVLRVKPTFSSFITGNVSDGEKTIYYVDCVGVQYKRSSTLIGYLQLETAGSIMNNRASNFFNENSFTFEAPAVPNEFMDQVAAYVKQQVDACKHRGAAPVTAALSPADEIRKYKELADAGILSQEEFEAKKRALLGI